MLPPMETAAAGSESAESKREKEIRFISEAARLYVAAGELHALLRSQDLERIQEKSRHYWQAATRGWAARRHARVYLLELLRELPEFFRSDLAPLPDYVRANLERCREMFSADCKAPDDIPEQDRDAWLAFWTVYPDHARKLSAAEVAHARRLYFREEPNKWLELAELFERIGLGGVKPDTLASEDRGWRRGVPRSRISGSEK